RGDRLRALQGDGLTLRWPEGHRTLRLPVVAQAGDLSPGSDDAILLTVKSQDTRAALEDLRRAGFDAQPVFCIQNSVANEATALRLFPHVHGVNVMLPAQYVSPDETIAWCSPNWGCFDIGRYPNGSDDHDARLAADLTAGGIHSQTVTDVMAFKHGKLILNLANIVEAALGPGVAADDLREILRDEGRRVLDAAGIAWRDVGATDPRRASMQPGSVEGATRTGSSTSQSLARQVGSIETDYLNGEIALLGRLNGVRTPANTYATRLAARLVQQMAQPGSISVESLRRGLQG
ncbi:MAG: 2-dehydropantoate 2-reductase N-terminal domain-containing protein, partial [Pseudomonadota bacterium]